MSRALNALLAIACAFAVACDAAIAAERTNVLIVTVDDMSADSIGAFECRLEGTSPNVDRLASQGMKFRYAHVVSPNCMPSRNAMWSGRYPHNNRVEGFYQVPNPGYPVLADLMKAAGYFTGIRHKVSHSTPYSPYDWDLNLDAPPSAARPHAKDPASYGASVTLGIESAKAAGKPFCLVINVADPHKPFYAEGKRGETVPDPHVPSEVFTPEQVPVPGFLFDDPVVRKELSHYYSSVRRADDGVGAALAALDASGEAARTIVVFLSDHGMPLPFAKTQLYHHSTHTPLIVRWPGVTKPATVDERHMISGVDLLPTLLDVTGIERPEGLDGRTFAPLLAGETQEDREAIFKEHNENAGGSRDPMRAIQTKKFLYIFNPWSNGTRVMATATTGTSTYRRMSELSATDATLAARHDLYQHRMLEELYDVEADPDCLTNLINDPARQADADRLRGSLEVWMVKTGDAMLEVFRKRDDAAFREAYMQRMEAEAASRDRRGRVGEDGEAAADAAPNAGRRGRRNRRAAE